MLRLYDHKGHGGCASAGRTAKSWMLRLWIITEAVLWPGNSNLSTRAHQRDCERQAWLARYFSVLPETWMGLQTEYDLRVAAQTVGKQIEKRVHPHAA